MSGLGPRYPTEKPDHPYVQFSMGGYLFGNYNSLFCAGCGYGIIGHLFTRVFEDEKIDPKLFPLIIGIGCYTQLITLVHHTSQKVFALHGRAPALATGMKMANPKLKPIVLTGDGDCLGIGGNHFIHACRRNIDCIIFIFNNGVYGMTGGQMAPTTLFKSKTSTSPTELGMIEPRIDGMKIAIAAGASYVARTTVAHPRTLLKYFKKALYHKGTSIIEVVTPCVTYFGRKNPNPFTGEKMDSGGKMIEWIKGNCVRCNQAKFMSDEDLLNKYVIGEFHYDPNKPEFSNMYKKVQEISQK